MCEVVSHELVMGGHFAEETELQLERVAVFSHPPTAFFIEFSKGERRQRAGCFSSFVRKNKLSCFLSSSCHLGWWSGLGRLGW